MAAPSLSLVVPFLRVPLVARSALTVALDLEGRPAPASVGFRVYANGDTPPDWYVKILPAIEPEVRVHYTWDGLEDGVQYVIEAYTTNADGTSSTVSDLLVWDPEIDLYPPASPTYSSGERPWAWEDYATQWLAMVAWYHRADPFTAAMFERISEEFQRLAAAVEQVERFVMPSRAYDDGLRLWERFLGIRPPDTLPEPRRRAMVMAHLRARVDASAALFIHSLENILGADPKVTENFNAYEVTINTEGSPEIQKLVEEVVERIMPAHLLVNFNPITFRFDYRERRAPILGLWPRGRATNRPADERIAGFDSGGLL